MKQIESNIFAEMAVSIAWKDTQDNLCCGADHGAVQMAPIDLTLGIACAHVDMEVRLSVHAGQGACQRGNLIEAGK